jgi:hypothetical protein
VTVAQLAPAAPPPFEIVSAFELLKNFKPIESIVDGLPIGRGAIVAITGQTGHAKTTLCTLLEVALVKGLHFAGREVTKGSVLVLAGENPHDYTMHLAGQVQDLGLHGAQLSQCQPDSQMLVVPGTFSIDFELDYLITEVTHLRCTDLVAVFVDTSAAFYSADDENDNVAMRRHASVLRELSTLPGNPTVFVLCHPTKNAQRDNLLPRGGGSFLAEIDCNLTLWKDEANIVSLHWAGKIRGPSFEPIRFELVPITLEGYVDCRGKPISSVVARHLAEERAEHLAAKAASDDDTLLIAMQRKPNGSVRELAMACGWTTGGGVAQKSRAHARLQALKGHGWSSRIAKALGGSRPRARLTRIGCHEVPVQNPNAV